MNLWVDGYFICKEFENGNYSVIFVHAMARKSERLNATFKLKLGLRYVSFVTEIYNVNSFRRLHL
jgi:hypothetical protein